MPYAGFVYAIAARVEVGSVDPVIGTIMSRRLTVQVMSSCAFYQGFIRRAVRVMMTCGVLCRRFLGWNPGCDEDQAHYPYFGLSHSGTCFTAAHGIKGRVRFAIWTVRQLRTAGGDLSHIAIKIDAIWNWHPGGNTSHHNTLLHSGDDQISARSRRPPAA